MSKTKLAVDADTAQLMRDLEQGLQEAVRGEGRINTPEQIKAHKQPVTVLVPVATPQMQIIASPVLAAMPAVVDIV